MCCFPFLILLSLLGQTHLVRGTPDLNDCSERQAQSLSCADLPNELIQEIFSHLSFKDISRARQVCKRWDAALNKQSFWQKYFYEELDTNDLYYPPWPQLSDQALKHKLVDRILALLTHPEMMENHHHTLVNLFKFTTELSPNSRLTYNINQLADLGVSWAKVMQVRQVNSLSYQYQYLWAKYAGKPWAMQEVCLDAIKDCWGSDPKEVKAIVGHLSDAQGSLLAAFPRYWGISPELNRWLLDFYSTYASLYTLEKLFVKCAPKSYEHHKHRGLGLLAWALEKYNLISAGNRIRCESSAESLTRYFEQKKAKYPQKSPLFDLLEKIGETPPTLDKLQDDAFMYNFLKTNAPQKATSEIYMEMYAQFCARRFLRYASIWTNLGQYVQLFRDLK